MARRPRACLRWRRSTRVSGWLRDLDAAEGCAHGDAGRLLGADADAQVSRGELRDDPLVQEAEGRFPLQAAALGALQDRDDEQRVALHHRPYGAGVVPRREHGGLADHCEPAGGAAEMTDERADLVDLPVPQVPDQGPAGLEGDVLEAVANVAHDGVAVAEIVDDGGRGRPRITAGAILGHGLPEDDG